ncbi:MAG: 4Fe-4S binding protein [Synergistaceae bacterium]|nr:4Fe-4S binding protein [Synergistaceae bacterium]
MIGKEDIAEYAKSLGASLVGFAPVSRWGERLDLPRDFHPGSIWPSVMTVICVSMPSLLPIVETKVSNLYRAQYDIINRGLDETTYLLALYLNNSGCASIPICRDGYGEQKMLRKNPIAAFSHVWAAYYAGLGTIGWNHTLITRKFGPRHRLASVFTVLEIEGDPMIKEELCIRCGICEKSCPEGVYSGTPGVKNSYMNKTACAGQTFDGPYNHCGFCIKTCPVGDDRKLYLGASNEEYSKAHADISQWNMGVFATLGSMEAKG